MKYTDEEKKIIDEVKKYLRELRLINIEKFSLTFEIEDIPSPQSIKYSDEAPGGFSKSKGEQITSNMLRRELSVWHYLIKNWIDLCHCSICSMQGIETSLERMYVQEDIRK